MVVVPDSYHMTSAEFRRHGYAMVDWVADYMDGVGELPVQSTVRPGDLRAMIPDTAPEAPEAFEDIMADLDRIVVPGLTNWQSPGWFAFFPGNASPAGTLAELAANAVGQQGMLWASSPICTELEMATMDWLVDLLGLPETWKISVGPGGGVIQPTASDVTHTALVVARDRAERSGAAFDMDLVAYTSNQAHSSVEKGARVAGYRHIRLVDVDDQFAMDVASLRAMVAADRAAGLVPTFVCSAVGTTGTAAVDPVRQIGEIARSENMWHHVDAAYAGNAMMCEEFRHHQDGLELADSYVVNPYKMTGVNFDGSCMFVADRATLILALSILPPYLRNAASETGEVIDYRDWHVALGRRFRSLKLWFVLRSYGAEGLRHGVREHRRLAQELAAKIEADPRLELVAPTFFGLVCFRHMGGDEPTDALANAVNESGHSYWTASRLADRSMIRASIGQLHTGQEHVDRLWALIDELAAPV